VGGPDEKRRWFRRRWSFVVLAVCGVVVGLLLVWALLAASARRSLQHQLAEVRTRGEPLTRQELAPSARPGDGEASARLDKALQDLPPELWLSSLGAEAWWQGERPDFSEYFSRHRDEAESALAAGEEALTVVEKALEDPVFHYASLPSRQRQTPVPLLPSLQWAFAAQALSRARSGDGAGAAESVTTVFKIARVFFEDASDLSIDFGFCTAAVGLDILDDITRRAVLPEDACRHVIAEMRGLDFLGAVTHRAIGERVLTLEDARDERNCGPLTALPGDEPGKPIHTDGCIGFVFDRDAAEYLAAVADFIDSTRRRPWEALPSVLSVEGRLDEKSMNAKIFACGVRRLRYAGRIYAEAVRLSARRDAALIGLNCELYRLRHARYPAELAALVPELLSELPADPFTGRGFTYRPEGAAVSVYSWGPDSEDDGGRDDDICWGSGGVSGRGER